MKLINKILYKLNLQIISTKEILPEDLNSDLIFLKIFKACRPYTMTTPERMFALYESVKYVIANNISGDFVECGVWKGGSSMIIALTLIELGATNRNLYLYDTFEGMSNPSKEDISIKGDKAEILLKDQNKKNINSIWCYSSIEEVKKNFFKTQYPEDKSFFIKGKVEDTIPEVLPTQIALLRLDTDWYESTKHELKHLFPKLTKNGVLIIDDFGYWEGAKKAVVEYFKELNEYPLFQRIDTTGRLILKLKDR